MAPQSEADKRKELKAKLAQKAGGSHKAAKETKAQAKEKADKAEKEAKEKAARDAQIRADREAKAKLARAAAPPQMPSPWADLNDEASQIGIHIGISCDGCGQTPPLIGKAMKCKDCPDFDLCDDCFPFRLDAAREAVAKAAGMPGKGKHPAAHCFAPRRATHVMTAEAVAAEKAAAAQAAKDAEAKEELMKARRERQSQGGVEPEILVEETAPKTSGTGSRSHINESENDSSIWRPSPENATLFPTPRHLPRVLGPP